jgi:hypothetical protein
MIENNILENHIPIRSTADYLNQLITSKKALNQLRSYESIILCGVDPGIHVYEGIGELAFAAGKKLEIRPRNCDDFPVELSFVHDGITFFQLKSQRAMAGVRFEGGMKGLERSFKLLGSTWSNVVPALT